MFFTACARAHVEREALILRLKKTRIGLRTKEMQKVQKLLTNVIFSPNEINLYKFTPPRHPFSDVNYL